jgi:hypothetical protein
MRAPAEPFESEQPHQSALPISHLSSRVQEGHGQRSAVPSQTTEQPHIFETPQEQVISEALLQPASDHLCPLPIYDLHKDGRSSTSLPAPKRFYTTPSNVNAAVDGDNPSITLGTVECPTEASEDVPENNGVVSSENVRMLSY